MPIEGSDIDYRRLFELSPGALLVLTPDLKIVIATDAYLTLTMRRREELVGRALLDVFPDNPDGKTNNSGHVRNSILKVFDTGKPDELPNLKYDVERPAELGGGFEERYWRIDTCPGFDDNGSVGFVYHRVENITEQVRLERKNLEQQKLNTELEDRAKKSESERKEAAVALEDAQLRLKFALAAGEIGTWTWDAVNDSVVADENLAKFFSVSEEDANGGKLEKYLNKIHPDDTAVVEDLINRSLAEKDSYEAEYRLINPDDSIRWVVARGRVLRDDNGKMLQLPGVVIDITERKETEENLSESNKRFQLVTRATNDAIWDWNLQNDSVWWNIGVQTMFGYKPEQVEQTAKWWYEHIHPDDRDRIVDGIHAVIDNGGENWADEYRFLCADGGYKYVFDRGFATHRDNKPVRMIGAMQDVSENKAIEAEREHLLWSEKNARAESERANRMKDEFLATLSHELRTPLTSILGWSRMLKENQIKGEQVQRALEIIDRNAQAQSQLIEDVLDVSRIISGKLRIDVRPIELASVIEMAIESVRPAAEAKNIRLQKVIDPNVMISGDADRIQQIVWNLLSNAIKFTPKEGRVQIKLERVNSHVEITVADNGLGIENESIPYIFERFRQIDSSTTRNQGGLGLGLAIVRHLVELHGGTVQASSSGLHQGSTFTVMFPLIALRSKEVPRSNATESERIHPTADSTVPFTCPPEIAGLRILLVDDEPDTREILMFIFQACGAEPHSVSSVAEALEAIKTNEFAVLVSDIGMPGLDGYELIKNIRRLSPDQGGRIQAVALTAYARVEDRMRALIAGFQMHVPKPVDPAELVAVVASLINRLN